MTVPLLAMALAVIIQASPEPSGVLAIRERYNGVKADLYTSPDIYRTEIHINPDDTSYPALGHFQESIILYWWSRAGESGLVMAVCSGGYAAHNEYTEVLYGDDGTPQFMLFSYSNDPETTFEERRWYRDGAEFHATGRMLSPDGEESYELLGFNAPRDPAYFMELFELIH